MLPDRALPAALAVALSVLCLARPATAEEDFRLLASLRSSEVDFSTDVVITTTITAYRGGVLRFEQEVAFGRQPVECSSRGRLALGKAEPALLQEIQRALAAAQVGQLTGGCLIIPGAVFSGTHELRWLGPFGDRTNLITYVQGPQLTTPPPRCPGEVMRAHNALQALANGVLAQPDTRLFLGSACFPER
jgi:hypothetical protein